MCDPPPPGVRVRHNLPAVPSGVSGVSFHPASPAILAVGTLSGQILVWDLAKPEGEKLIGTPALPAYP